MLLAVLDVMMRRRRFGERETRSDGRMDLALSVPGEQLQQPRLKQLRLVPHVPEVHTEKRLVVVDQAAAGGKLKSGVRSSVFTNDQIERVFPVRRVR